MDAPDTVLFDRDCPLCRSLAQFASGRAGGALRFLAWQDFKASSEADALGDAARALPADRLRVLTEGRLIEGEGAWGYLLATYQDLAALNWLAAKLGLTRAVSGAMSRSADLLKSLCWKCGKR